MIHLGVQNPLGQRLLQIIEQAIRIECALCVGASQKLVRMASGIRGSLRLGMVGLLCSHHAQPARNS